MKRTREHEIDDEASIMFRRSLPSSFVVRDQTKDYGIDSEVEVFENQEQTDCIFKVQQKGQEAPKLTHNNTMLSYSLPIEKGEYYIETIRIPTIIVVVDVTREIVYWVCPQTSTQTRNNYGKAVQNRQKSFTVRIPVENTLPETLNQLLNEVSIASSMIASRSITSASSAEAIAGLQAGEISPEKLLNKALALAIDDIDRRTEQYTPQAIAARIEQVLQDETVHPSLHIAALLVKEKQMVSSASDHGQRFEAQQQIARKISQCTRSAEPELQNFAKGMKLVAELAIAIEHDIQTTLSIKLLNAKGENQKEVGPQFARAQYEAQLLRLRAKQTLTTKCQQIGSYLEQTIEKKHYTLYPYLVERTCLPLLQHTRTFTGSTEQNHTRVSTEYINQEIQSAKQVALILDDYDQYANLVNIEVLEILTANKEDADRIIERAAESIDKIPRYDTRQQKQKSLLAFIAKLQARMLQVPDDDSWQDDFYQRQAAVLGIDPEDQEDIKSITYRVGLADRNPERVLKHCKHLFVIQLGGGLLAEQLNLPTAAPKALCCTKHKHDIIGLDLDGNFALLEQQYCNSCQEKEPHKPDWRWTIEWQALQHEKYANMFPDSGMIASP